MMTTNIARPGETRKRVMDFINGFYAQHYRPPTLREVKAGTGILSTSNVAFHLGKLVEAGKLQHCGDGKHRAYVPHWVVSAIRTRAALEGLTPATEAQHG